MNYLVSEPVTAKARELILALWGRNLPLATARRYDWLYETGPGKSWVATTFSGDLVGSTGLIGRTMKLHDRLCRAGQAIDLNVDAEHRTVGPALKLQRAVTGSLAERKMPLIYAMPSPQAVPVVKRIGYRLLGTIESWTKPLRSEYKLREYLKRPLAAKAAAFVVDQALRFTSAERKHALPAGFRVEFVSSFDARFDELWQAASREFGIIGERNAAYLNWRYASNPDAAYRTLCLVDRTNRLLGYIVYYGDDQGFVSMSDFLYADPAVLDALLAEFIRHLRTERVNAIYCPFFGTHAVTKALSKFGFSRRVSHRQLYVYLEKDCPGTDLAGVLDREQWFLTKADSDTDV